MTAWELAGRMSDTVFERIVDDLARVPLIDEALVDAHQTGLWLYRDDVCAGCGQPRWKRSHACLPCRNRHEKRRQRGRTAPAPLFEDA